MSKNKSQDTLPPNEEPHSIQHEGITIPWGIVNTKITPDNAVRYLNAKYVARDEAYKLLAEVNNQRMIDDLIANEHFIAPVGDSIDKECKNGDIELFCYENGVYKANGTHVVKKFCYSRVKAIMKKTDFETIIDYIKVHNRCSRDNLNRQSVLTMSDCNYNWITKQIEPHSPEILNTISIPVKWDNPDANVYPFQQFIEKVLMPDEIDAMYELIGYCLYYGNMNIRELFVFYGSQTACGKSVCANVITALLGTGNCNSATLSELVSNQFASSMIVGKMLNVCPEEPPGKLPTGRIKAWTGQDRMNSERKGKDAEANYTTAKMIVLSNHLPYFETDEESIFTRINVFNFPNSFKDEMDSKLTEKLTTPEVLSGIAQKSIEAFNAMEQSGKFSNWKPTDTRERMVHTVSNSLRAFSEIFIERGEFDECLTKHELHIIYTDNFCKVIGKEAKVMSKIVCGKLLPKILDYVEDAKRDKYVGESGSQERVWRFVKWRDATMITEDMRALMKSLGKNLKHDWEPLSRTQVIEILPPKNQRDLQEEYEDYNEYERRID